jgi:hypothetical protein
LYEALCCLGDGALRRIRPGIVYTCEVQHSPGPIGVGQCGVCERREDRQNFLRRSLASSQNRDVELADIASSEAATLDVHGAYGTTATLRKGRAKLMRHKALLGALVGAVLVLTAGCTSSPQEKASTQEKAYAPHINPADFTTKVDNEYFPLKAGTTFLYEGVQSATSSPSRPTPKR